MILLNKVGIVLACTILLILDLIYVYAVPVGGVFLGAYVAKVFHSDYICELILTLIVVVLAYPILQGLGLEAWFWRRLFGTESQQNYKMVLVVRVVFNFAVLYTSFYDLNQTVFSGPTVSKEEMLCGKDGKGKCHKLHLGDGIRPLLLKIWNLLLDNEPLKQSASWWERKTQQEHALQVEKMLKMTTFILSLCVITASVVKIFYFSKLFVYLEAGKAFVEMQQRNNRGQAAPAAQQAQPTDPDNLDSIFKAYLINNAYPPASPPAAPAAPGARPPPAPPAEEAVNQ